jgi:protein-S-isoprenylcysteine O-methyltransferase Ste14
VTAADGHRRVGTGMDRVLGIGRRPLAHAIASAVTIFFLVASASTTRTLDRLLWSLPHIVANISQLVLLALATARRPKDIDQGPTAFVAGVLGTIAPVFVAWFGPAFPFGAAGGPALLAGRWLNLAIMPFYLAAIWTLGASLTVLPEASTLRTSGVYSVSRHPLYATYFYWYVVQNLIFQSWAALGLSVLQIVLTFERARLEEGILAKNFPDYEQYRQAVTWFGRRSWFGRRTGSPADLA